MEGNKKHWKWKRQKVYIQIKCEAKTDKWKEEIQEIREIKEEKVNEKS